MPARRFAQGNEVSARKGGSASGKVHKADTGLIFTRKGKRNGYLCRQGKAQTGKIHAVMRGQPGGAFVLKGNDTKPETSIRRTGMRSSAVKAEHIARLGEPNLSVTGQQLATVEIAEQAHETQTDIVLVAMHLRD